MREQWLRYCIRWGWVLLLAASLLVLCMRPLGATGTARAKAQGTTAVNATVYLATDYLASMFSSHIDADVPAAFNDAVASMVSKLPKQDQGWALSMAQTLLSPSATLTSLTPQAGGLELAMRLRLYPGDPKPIDASSLVSFSVLDSSTVQVSAQPDSGSPALMSGPLSTFQIPLGTLNGVSSTPGCGNAALALNLKYPVTLGGAQASVGVNGTQRASVGRSSSLTANGGTIESGAHATTSPMQPQTAGDPGNAASAYIELPASSLAQLGGSIGSMPVGNGLTAQNIRLGVSGSDLTITSDIYWNGFSLGTAVTVVAPTAAQGKVVVHVVSTTFTVWFITFPLNSYNAQIESTLNAKIGGALAGRFTVTTAGIGPLQGLPCAAHDSLVLAGSASIGV